MGFFNEQFTDALYELSESSYKEISEKIKNINLENRTNNSKILFVISLMSYNLINNIMKTKKISFVEAVGFFVDSIEFHREMHKIPS